MRVRTLLPHALAVAALACPAVPLAAPSPARPVTRAAAKSASMPALSRADMDTTCPPCRDFYRYADGGWLARHTIPAAYPTWGSFVALAERNQLLLRGILERAAADTKSDPAADAGRLGAYWCACMDSTAADRAGARPIAPALAEIEAMASPAELPARVGALHARTVRALFAFRAEQDAKRSDLVIASLSQGGLGLPDRDYYLRTDSAAVATRARYVEHIVKSLELVGDPAGSARAAAEAILDLETSLARASMTNVERRDPNAVYHKIPADSLRRLCPAFDWSAYFAARGIAGLDSLNVAQPGFVQALDGLIGRVPLETWKSYLRWGVVSEAEPMLGAVFADEDFRFAQVLTGTEAQLPRWRRCLRWADRDLGDLLGRAYVKQEFPPEARARALGMVHNLESALADRIEALDWMEPETRRRAIAKLHAFEEKIGYPGTWRDYAGVVESRTDLVANHFASSAYEARRNLAKIGKPVDRGEWFMTTPTVNAFYSSSLNSINFPAGILQPPFFDPSWDDAVNYGGIGAVIGHEMTHGFDDRGRQFDPRGNLADWWEAEDATRYKERAGKVADQFSGYTVLDTLHVNGRLTLGENIADLGGVAVAYHALEKALAAKPSGKIDGFTPEQRFFLSYARVWASLQRPAALRTQVLTNPHAPPMWRVNGPLSNLPEFQQAFGCVEGDPMVRPADRRARIW
ncbi:MAG TPA: M13 family metallopeptidase [Candidatus Eisenbacteria bacterium]|jgi:predicted metalloendopeptidase